MGRNIRYREYMDFIRARPCQVSGDQIDIVAHHVRCLGGGGMGKKPSDYYCVSLTDRLHKQLHNVGEKSFWRSYMKDPAAMIHGNLLAYVDYGHASLSEMDAINFVVLSLRNSRAST